MKLAVDTSAIIAILFREAEAASFRSVLTQSEALLAGPVIIEATMVLEGRAVGDPVGTLAQFESEFGTVRSPFGLDMVTIAQDAFIRYGKGRHPAKLNFGDCMSYAAAKALDLPLLYKGDDFAQTDIDSALALFSGE